MVETAFKFGFAALSAWWIIELFLSLRRMRQCANLFVESGEYLWLMRYLEYSKWHTINMILAVIGGIYLMVYTGAGDALFG